MFRNQAEYHHDTAEITEQFRMIHFYIIKQLAVRMLGVNLFKKNIT
jgi:hypothetical protein